MVISNMWAIRRKLPGL